MSWTLAIFVIEIPALQSPAVTGPIFNPVSVNTTTVLALMAAFTFMHATWSLVAPVAVGVQVLPPLSEAVGVTPSAKKLLGY